MGLETGTYISDLVATNPVGATDDRATADDHLRLIKAVLQNTFPNLNGAVTATPAELNVLTGAFIKTLLASADLATAQSVLEIQNLIDAAKLVTFAGILNSSGASEATKYYHPNGNVSDVYTSPNVVAAPSPADFTLTSFHTRLATNTFNGPLTLTVMVNGVATVATVTYTAAETGAKSWSGSVAISAGDTIEVRFAESATTGNISQLVWAMS